MSLGKERNPPVGADGGVSTSSLRTLPGLPEVGTLNTCSTTRLEQWLICEIDSDDRRSQDIHVERSGSSLSTLYRGFHGRRSGGGCIQNSRFTTRKTENTISDTKRRTRRIQASDLEGAEKDVERRGLARLHERKWYQLHTYHSVLSGPIWGVQHLQERTQKFRQDIRLL